MQCYFYFFFKETKLAIRGWEFARAQRRRKNKVCIKVQLLGKDTLAGDRTPQAGIKPHSQSHLHGQENSEAGKESF